MQPTTYDRPLPVPDLESAPYWEACRRHELRFQRCGDCGTFRFPPNPICHACRYFWRQNGRRTDQLDQELAMLRPDPESVAIFDLLPSQLAVREALDALSPRYAQILRMRYYDGYTIREIADYLGVTAKYTQKLVGKCLRMAEQMYNAAPARKKKMAMLQGRTGRISAEGCALS